jgi:predicted XRE-type DNA-binding protein
MAGRPKIRKLRFQMIDNTYCTPFRKSPRKAFLLHKKRSNLSSSGSPRRNGITKKGRTEMQKNSRTRVKEGSGNIFRDLGFPNPEREQLKARLTLEIYRLIKGRGLNQTEAGRILGIQQPHVSGLMRGNSGNFSVERLMDFLTSLGQDVEITVKPTRREHGEVSLVFG